MDSKDNGDAKEEVEKSNEVNSQIKPSGSLAAFQKRMDFMKFRSPSARFMHVARQRDDFSRSVGASSSSNGHHGIRDRLNGVFRRKIDWGSLMDMGKKWIRDPMNLALFVWILCVAISGAILFLVMTGMLNAVIPKKSVRETWYEVNNQILNALFTLMCLYQHPKRFYHLVLLIRWRPEDIAKLRKLYCKNGTYKPHEWAHMMVVVVLLHINCFAQYALCGLNLGYKRSTRPAIGVAICISVAIAAPAIAGVYTIVSPLGKDYATELDVEEGRVRLTPDLNRPEDLRRKSLEKRYSFAPREEQAIVESNPQWSGGIFDFWEDLSLAYLSLFCSFCVFGWNMERLGFGNMFVHIATFILFCIAPFWIFILASVNIDNETAREILGVTGVVLCAFGLLYGGFWRIQMRKRFKLPAYTFCCNQPAVSDCALWLFCCWCSLAQEARTGNSYDIVEDHFCKKPTENSEQPPISPLPREDGVAEYRSSPNTPHGYIPSPLRAPDEHSSPVREMHIMKNESPIRGNDETMIPPATSTIQR